MSTPAQYPSAEVIREFMKIPRSRRGRIWSVKCADCPLQRHGPALLGLMVASDRSGWLFLEAVDRGSKAKKGEPTYLLIPGAPVIASRGRLAFRPAGLPREITCTQCKTIHSLTLQRLEALRPPGRPERFVLMVAA